jgi:Uma2 family endonuclease
MKDIVLDAKAIPRLPEIRKEMKEGDKIVISNYAWQRKWLVKGRGYLLEIDRLVKELRSEGKLIIGPMEITYEEFLEWCDEDTLAEWVDGKIVTYSPASRRHQQLAAFLLHITGIFVETKALGTMLIAPFQMKIESTGREPDLLFISKERENLLKETHLQGPADLVIEIVSLESRLRDKEEKFAEYEKGGVKEYWLIDPDLKEANFYLQDEQGQFKRQELDALGIYRSQVLLGFQLKVEWLWQDPLPPTFEVLRELRLV